jgi:hypothetical protein
LRIIPIITDNTKYIPAIVNSCLRSIVEHPHPTPALTANTAIASKIPMTVKYTALIDIQPPLSGR